ncbi:hypothetical protein AB0E00_24625 [Streptomyces sp. NPDC048110]|uniref:rhamnogalacturonan lyase family protein n=1 Tax=Streptomyces sp. NPDC048110 TaxID=3155483 RepID=UPI0033D0A60B
MEHLGRGVVAVRSSSTDVLVTWRLLGLDPDGIGFNVYRKATGEANSHKINAEVLTGATNFLDTTADLTRTNSYRVRPVINGKEQPSSASFTLTASHAQEPVVRVPLQAGGPIKFTWAGDLDGDGEYDYVVDRQTSPQSIEAYRSDGTLLWQMDLGVNSTNQNNIEPGSSAVDVGHWDGVTVQDLDSDGRAEVAIRIANGVTFGDGKKFTYSDDTHQFIAVLDGQTGAARATAPVPDDYIDDGPMGARLGVGYLDGKTPSLVAYMKNRVGSAGFNLMYAAWRFNGSTLTRQWKWLRGNQDAADGHNTRIVDVDGDGMDEIAEIGFVLNGDGTLRYSLASQGVIHGDRFYIGKMDPDRPGLQGYGIQQDNAGGLREYYYDATNGEIIWKHSADDIVDVGRGLVGDIDPRHKGMEAWSFSGIYNAPTNKLTEPDTALSPWPALGIWWDGDLGMELLNNERIEKWDPDNPQPSGSLPRLLTTYKYGGIGVDSPGNPTLVGDLMGDWREEAVYPNVDHDELVIFTTDRPTDTRLYTLAHNPAYRNAMTLKGYLQSHELDYYLGNGMSIPPRPKITYTHSGS